MKKRTNINNQIRSREVRLINEHGDNVGVTPTNEAIEMAVKAGLDLIEISPNSKPPVAKITDYGKYQYDEKKKAKEAKAKSNTTETKAVQIKIATGDNDLQLKAKRASEWLKEGHRIKVELYLVGRAKYTGNDFKKERLERILNLITENYKIAQPLKKSPKGMMMIIERDKGKKKEVSEKSNPNKKETPSKEK